MFIFPALLVTILLVTQPILATMDSTATNPLIVNHIQIHGNKTTNEKLVRMYLEIDSGATVDSVILHNAKQRLLKSGLFLNVALVTLNKENSTYLYVILKERFYFTPDAGGGYYRYKYGKEELWFRFNLSIDYRNFRGFGERIKVSLGFWDWRNLSISWSKPFLPSKYYISIGAACDYHPDQTKKINHLQYTGRVSFGRSLLKNSKTGIAFIASRERQQSTENFSEIRASELFSVIGWETDYKNRTFNTSQGWFIYSDLWSNHLHHNSTPAYLQLNTIFKTYYPGFFNDNTIALLISTSFRNKDAGLTHHIGLGGSKTVRGYPQPIIGNSINGNNTLLLSMEYRFPIFRLPILRFPVLPIVKDQFESLDVRVNGALIADYGRVAETPSDLMSIKSNRIESGIGLGVSLRVLFPDFETSGNIDMVFAQDVNEPRGTVRFYSIPEFHLYLNFPY